MSDFEGFTIVLAGTYREYVMWCYDHGLNPWERDLVYPTSVDNLRGISKVARVVQTGTFWNRPDAHRIRTYLRDIVDV